MVEKGWNKHYKIDITLKVNKDKKPEGLTEVLEAQSCISKEITCAFLLLVS